MLKVSNLSKSFGTHVLFNNVQFQMQSGERLGFVGRNGYGKTTLIRMILGEDLPDEGEITVPKNYSIGHLNQHIHFTEKTAVTEAALGLPPGMKDNLWEVEKILAGLGFSPSDMEKPPQLFSGGYQIRINLAKVLVSQPDLLLLDEPTNYLDILSIRWLAEFLRKWKREIILITHDRHFMDSVTTHSMIIYRQQIRKVSGSTRKLIQQIELEEEVHENTRVNEEKKRKQEEKFINKFRAKARMAGMVQSRIKALEKRTVLEKLDALTNLEFQFRSAPFPAKVMMSCHNLNFSYDNRDANGPIEPLIRNFSLSIGSHDRVAIIGKNGKGKSTLMKILCGALNPHSGSLKKHPLLQIGYYEQTNVMQLDPERTVAEEICAADPDKDMRRARDICGAMMFDGDKGLKKIAVLSGGEKSRVCLGKLLISPCHLLLLDEPTNHLDPESCDALSNALKNFKGSVVLITHHEGLLKQLPNKLVVFQSEGHTHFEGTYPSFLKEVGWETEAMEKKSSSTTSTQSTLNKKEQRRMNAERRTEIARILKPLQSKVNKLECLISETESEINETNLNLIIAYESGETEDSITLSKKLHDLQNKSEDYYRDLDHYTQALEEKQKEVGD